MYMPIWEKQGRLMVVSLMSLLKDRCFIRMTEIIVFLCQETRKESRSLDVYAVQIHTSVLWLM